MGVLIGSFLVLMLLGLPVALAMVAASLLYILVTGSVPNVIVAQRMIACVESFPLLAVPFFILAGNLMNIAGITGRIYHFAVALVGWMRGGLGQVNIIGSVIFSGMCGTAIATRCENRSGASAAAAYAAIAPQSWPTSRTFSLGDSWPAIAHRSLASAAAS